MGDQWTLDTNEFVEERKKDIFALSFSSIKKSSRREKRNKTLIQHLKLIFFLVEFSLIDDDRSMCFISCLFSQCRYSTCLDNHRDTTRLHSSSKKNRCDRSVYRWFVRLFRTNSFKDLKSFLVKNQRRKQLLTIKFSSSRRFFPSEFQSNSWISKFIASSFCWNSLSSLRFSSSNPSVVDNILRLINHSIWLEINLSTFLNRFSLIWNRFSLFSFDQIVLSANQRKSTR